MKQRAIILLLSGLLLSSLPGCDARFRDYTQTEFVVEALKTDSGTVYRVEKNDCRPYELSPQQPVAEGCYIESARWQSLVHPEKMISVQPVTPSAGHINTDTAPLEKP